LPRGARIVNVLAEPVDFLGAELGDAPNIITNPGLADADSCSGRHGALIVDVSRRREW
jgi:hypothetical protein